MKTPTLSIILFAIAAVLGAAGQFLYKSGAARITSSPWSFLNLRLLGGASITGLSMTPCVAAPVKKAAPKKSAPAKKSAED